MICSASITLQTVFTSSLNTSAAFVRLSRSLSRYPTPVRKGLLPRTRKQGHRSESCRRRGCWPFCNPSFKFSSLIFVWDQDTCPGHPGHHISLTLTAASAASLVSPGMFLPGRCALCVCVWVWVYVRVCISAANARRWPQLFFLSAGAGYLPWLFPFLGHFSCLLSAALSLCPSGDLYQPRFIWCTIALRFSLFISFPPFLSDTFFSFSQSNKQLLCASLLLIILCTPRSHSSFYGDSLFFSAVCVPACRYSCFFCLVQKMYLHLLNIEKGQIVWE